MRSARASVVQDEHHS